MLCDPARFSLTCQALIPGKSRAEGPANDDGLPTSFCM
jgi:hypothetical protein